MTVTDYIDERLTDFNSMLETIAAARAEEIRKPPEKRNYNLLYMLHRDQALYEFSSNEFNNIKMILKENG